MTTTLSPTERIHTIAHELTHGPVRVQHHNGCHHTDIVITRGGTDYKANLRFYDDYPEQNLSISLYRVHNDEPFLTSLLSAAFTPDAVLPQIITTIINHDQEAQ